MEEKGEGTKEALQERAATDTHVRLHVLRGRGTEQLLELVQGEEAVPGQAVGSHGRGPHGGGGEWGDGGDHEPMTGGGDGLGPGDPPWERDGGRGRIEGHL